MRVSEVVGGLAVVGVITLVGVSLTQDDSPDRVTSSTASLLSPVETASTVPSSTATTPPSTEPPSGGSTSVPPATAATSAPPTTAVPTTTAAPTTAATTTSTSGATTTSATAAPTTAATTTTEVPRDSIEIQVLNGNAGPGAAGAMTAQLEEAGFEPRGPADAVDQVERTVIFYAPGQEAAARTVNTEVGAPDDQVVEAPEDDPSWLRWGEGVDVMVILGPE